MFLKSEKISSGKSRARIRKIDNRRI